jgi:hypothetical protein
VGFFLSHSLINSSQWILDADLQKIHLSLLRIRLNKEEKFIATSMFLWKNIAKYTGDDHLRLFKDIPPVIKVGQYNLFSVTIKRASNSTVLSTTVAVC